jgi:alcohol dehydrogenase
MLLKSVEAKKIDPEKLIAHHFSLNDIEKAYEVFGNAAKERAIKVIMTNE